MFPRKVHSTESFTHDLNFEACDAAVDPRITTAAGANRTRVNGSGVVEDAAGARVDHKRIGRTNTLKSSVDMSDAAYWLQNVGGWWTSAPSFDKPPPERGARVTKYVRTAAAAGDAVFTRCNSLSIPAGARSGSVYIWVPSGQGVTSFRVHADWQDVEQGTQVTSALFDQWVRINSTATVAATRTFLDFNIAVNGGSLPSTGFTWYCAAPQESDALTAWIPTGAASVTVYDSRGLLQEPLSNNSIRNADMIGASVGTSSVNYPTYWVHERTPSEKIEIVGLGTESGMNYIDVRFWAAPASWTYTAFFPEAYGVIAAAAGETHTTGFHIKLVAGSQGSAVIWIYNRATNSGGAPVADAQVAVTPPASSADLKSSRFTATLTCPATTVSIAPNIVITFAPGTAYDFTLRIALPTQEKSAFATTPIRTALTALTATPATHFLSGSNFSSYFTPQGTYLIEFTPYALTNNEVYWGIGQASVFNNSMYLVNSAGSLYLIVYSAGVNTAALDLGVLVAGTRYKVGISYQAGEIAARCNGGAERVSSGAMPAVIDTEGLLTTPWNGGSSYPAAHMHRRRYRPIPGRGQLYQLTA